MSVVEQFGKYLLLEKIAAGGMAEVYLAKSTGATGLNKFFAIKRILPQFSSNEDFVSMFKDEANVAINLNHSNVVSIFDFGIEQSQFYLVMDYVEGRNLRQIINELKKNNKSFSIDQALFIVKEAAAGLDHAHRCTDSKSGRPLNITHRDMSPQNVMVSFEGEVKVIDFGIAKAETEQEETKTGTLKGKFGYMSPEQAEGLQIDPRTDVFALGIVLWELLANDRLFTGSNEAAILRKVRDCQIPSIRKVNPTVPPELERIVMKALAKDRNVRYQTAANFHRDLNRFLNTQFPDFSSHDFSQFVKENFKTAFQDGRDKLVQFSQIQAPHLLEATVTAVPRSYTNPPPTEVPREAAPRNVMAPTPPVADPTVPPGGFAPPQGIKINLDGVMDAVGKTTMKRPGPNGGKSPQPFNKTAFTNIQHTRSGNFNAKKDDDLAGMLFKLILIAALGYGGYIGYNNMSKIPGLDSFRSASNQPAIKLPVESGEIDMAATASVKVSVASTPPGATIFLNGKNTGYYTPAIISVTANRLATFTLRREGYLDYESVKKFSQTSQFSATLQAASRPAYVNIYLSNGGPTTKISVGGKDLSEPIPVTKYAITADKDVHIKAFNPITQLSDEVIVNLKPGESRNIDLILGRAADQMKK